MRKILLICTVFYPVWLFSENNIQSSEYSPGIKIGCGQSFVLYERLNSLLINSGYYPVDKDNLFFLSYGVEFSAPKQPFYLSLTVQQDLNTVTTGGNYKSYINYAGLNLDMFYDFCRNDKWVLAPMFGAGLSSVNLSAVSTNKISELTQIKLQETLSKKDLFCIKPGIAIKRFFSVSGILGSIGMDCCYQIETGSGKWKDVSNRKADNFAVSKMTGFVFCLNSSIYFP